MIYYILSFFVATCHQYFLFLRQSNLKEPLGLDFWGHSYLVKILVVEDYLRWVGSTIQVGLAISRGKNLRSDLFEPINTLNRQSSSQSYGVPYSLISIRISLWSNFPKQYMQQPSCLLIFLSISSAAIASIPLILLS